MRMIRNTVIALMFGLLIFGCNKRPAVFKDNLGNEIHLTNTENRWLIVNFWASWCPSCIKEIPELNKFYNSNKDKVTFVGVNYDPSPNEDFNTTLKKLNIQFPVLLNDPSSDWNLDNIEAIPTTFIFNPEGKVVQQINGETTAKELTDFLAELQKGKNGVT